MRLAFSHLLMKMMMLVVLSYLVVIEALPLEDTEHSEGTQNSTQSELNTENCYYYDDICEPNEPNRCCKDMLCKDKTAMGNQTLHTCQYPYEQRY